MVDLVLFFIGCVLLSAYKARKKKQNASNVIDDEENDSFFDDDDGKDPYLAMVYRRKAVISFLLTLVGVGWYIFGHISGYADAEGDKFWGEPYIIYVIGCTVICLPLAIELYRESQRQSYKNQEIYGRVSSDRIEIKSNRFFVLLMNLFISVIVCLVVANIALVGITIFRFIKTGYCLLKMNKYEVKPKRKTSRDNRVHKTVNNSSSNEKEVHKQYNRHYIYISKKTARKYLDPENKEDVILKLDRKHTYVFSKIAIHESRCADTRHKTYIFAEAKNEECPWAKTFFGIDYDAKGRPYLMIEDSEIVYNLILDYDFKQVEKDETWYCLSNEDAIKKAKMEECFYLHVKDENGKIRDAFCHGVVYGGDDKLEMILPHDYYLITYLTYDGTEFDEEDERNMQVYILEEDEGKVYSSYYKTYSYLCKDLKIRNEVLEVFKKPDLSNPIVAKIYNPDDLSSFTLSLDGLPEIRYISLGSVSYENNYYALLRPIEQTDIFSGDTVIVQIKRNRIILLSDEKIAAAVCEEYQKLVEEDKRNSAAV